MRIKQVYSNFGIGFKEGAMKRYNLVEYTNPHEPMLMIGCYNWNQLAIPINHARTGVLCVIYWCGSDALILSRQKFPYESFWAEQFRSNPNIKHIAASHWIADDLKAMGIPYYELPVVLHDHSMIKPEPLGQSIYIYNPDKDTYTDGIYHKIKEVLPYNFIEATVHTYTREQLLEAYKNSFIGLRFTGHDGLSETVCELGLMGRMVIHNGDTPNSIPYDKNNIDAIIDTIHREYKNAHDLGMDKSGVVAGATFDYLNIGEDWLDTEFYGTI
jgi:hypothetical protein